MKRVKRALATQRPRRDRPGDPGLVPTLQRGPSGPYVGAPPSRHPLRRFAREPTLDRLLRELYAGYGPQHWWPAETPFEVMIGAILVQNATWESAERALAALRRARSLAPAQILALERARLERLLRPAGTFRVKAERLCALCRWYLDTGGLRPLVRAPVAEARASLLAVRGIGDETADAILCYAAGRAVPVVDAYARRVLGRHGFDAAGLSTPELRAWLAERLLPRPLVHQEFHALCVRAGREHCKTAPHCTSCPATAPDSPAP